MSSDSEGGVEFDHGAQFFTVRSNRFQRTVETWLEAGVVDRWTARLAIMTNGRLTPTESNTERFVGSPRMGSICEHLAKAVDVRSGARVDRADRLANRWTLFGEDGSELGTFDVLAVATPPAQALPFLSGAHRLLEAVQRAEMAPCWAVMAVFDADLGTEWDAALVDGSALAWAARDGSKPGRPEKETWIFHASPKWSLANIETSPDRVIQGLGAAFFDAAGIDPVPMSRAKAYRWRDAKTVQPADVDCLWDPTRQLGVCGDWCLGSRVEDAFRSGLALAAWITGDRP